MKDKIFGILQRVGRSFMLPIAILPVAGLLLGIGSPFTNEKMLIAYGLMDLMGPGTFLNMIFQVMSRAGSVVFDNLPIIFAMGVAIGMAKKEKEVAALAAAIAFFVMHASISAMISVHGGADAMLEGATASVVGITSLQMGVFGGTIVGLGVAALHNRFYKIELPQALSFFGGTKFVPIISSITYVVVGIVMYYIWPSIQEVIYHVGDFVLNSGYVGTWVYGLMERALIPFGLHHVFYLPIWQTGVGGSQVINGVLVEGAQNIFFAQLADSTIEHFSVSATRFMSGKFPLMMFGLPGAAYAMYKTAKPEKRKAVSGLLMSAALTSMLTGITEPIEFTFLFLAPGLYAIHCVLAGAAYMFMHMCNVGVGMTFSGGLVDFFLFGILQGNEKTNWAWIIIIGLLYFVVYYWLFTVLIRKLDLKTPGRDDSEEVKLYTKTDIEAKKKDANTENRLGEVKLDSTSAKICAGLGGVANISDIDCCATRLRCTVYKEVLVNETLLKETGASGVVCKGNGVQIIYGPQVSIIKSNLDEYMQQVSSQMAVEEDIEEVEERGDNYVKDVLDNIEKNTEHVVGVQENVPEGVQKTIIVHSPISGIAADLGTTPDEAFASRMMGDGAVVIPAEDIIYAPDDGVIRLVFETKHALAYETVDGVTILLHVGIDTVALNGQGFEVLVKNGDTVKKGDKLMQLDLDFLSKNAPSLATPVLCMDMKENQKVRLLKEGNVKAGDTLFAIDCYGEE